MQKRTGPMVSLQSRVCRLSSVFLFLWRRTAHRPTRRRRMPPALDR